MISHCQTVTGGLDIEVSGFNAQVKINMFLTLILWICAAPKYWYPLEICFSKDDTLLGKAYMPISPKFNWGIKAMSLPGVSVTVAKCNHLAAQFCGPYPVCLVLAANALFMNTLLRVPYGVVVGSRCWLASGLPLSGAGIIGWAGLNAAHGVTTGCLRQPASGCADVDRNWDDRAIYGGEVLTWIPWTRNL